MSSISKIKAPELHELFKVVNDCPDGMWLAADMQLSRARIRMPAWAVPYIAADTNRTCLRYNHTAGKGCTRSDCNRVHTCFVCGSDTHGTFFRRGDRQVICRTQRAWARQLTHNGYPNIDDFVSAVVDGTVQFTDTD